EIAQVAGDVPVLAVDQHEVAARIDVVRHRFVEIQLRALLVVVGHFLPATSPDLAGGGFEFAEQKLEQGALARAIRADDADALAAKDPRGEAAEYLPAVEGNSGVFGFEDELAGSSRLLHGHAGLPRSFAALAPLDAHGLQRADTALIAG